MNLAQEYCFAYHRGTASYKGLYNNYLAWN